jgi:hypothetical protein
MKKRIFLLLFVTMTAALNGNAAPPENLTKDVFVTLWSGTPVSLELNEELNSRDVTTGQTVSFIVRSNVVVNGKVLIATGMSAEGYISEKKRKCDRDCAEIKIVMETVQTVDGQRVFLMDTARKAILDCCRGDATLSIGTVFSAKIRNDVQVQA